MTTTTAPAIDSVPSDLRDCPQWIVWREEERDGDPTKVPYQVDGKYAKTSDSSTWTDFETAREAARSATFDGIGFVFTSDDLFVGIDLDKCISGGQLTGGARKIVNFIDSYTEVSPSGTGLHIICQGTIPGDNNRTGDVEGMKEFEVYESGRYFTVTGDVLDVHPKTIETRPKQLKELCEKAFGSDEPETTERTRTPKPVANIDDRELIEKAKNAKNGDKFRRLWNGDISGHHDDHSRADQALVNLLAYWTGGDRRRIDRLFRQSGLCREKWTDRPDYRKRTIDKALDGRTEFYEPSTLSKMGPRGNGRTSGTAEENSLTGWDRINALYENKQKREARLEAAEQAINERSFATRRQTRRLYVYDPNAHVYDDGGEQALSELLVDKLGTNHSRHEEKEIGAKVRALTFQDSFGGPYVHLANGDLDIESLELKDSKPKRAPLARSPAAWDPNADCPLFRTHLKTVIPDERERATLQEYVGYALLHWKLPFHKALFLVGPTASGKSTTLDVVRLLLGQTSSLTPQQLVNGRFGPSELEGAWANIRADISAALLKDVGLFKEIVAGDPIYVERKYEQGYTLNPTAKHLYSANRLPKVQIDDDAFFRRILLVSFPKTIPREDRDPKLGDRLELELDGVLQWAVTGLRRVLDNEGFTHDRTPTETRHQWEAHSSSIGRFKTLRLDVTGDAEDVEPKQKVYSAFTAFCQEEGLSSESQRKFTRTLKGDPRITDADRTPTGESSQVSCYVGVTLPESEKPPF